MTHTRGQAKNACLEANALIVAYGYRPGTTPHNDTTRAFVAYNTARYDDAYELATTVTRAHTRREA